jgi:hypothetical protein
LAGKGRGHPKYWRVPKWAKTVFALILLPVCYGAGEALIRVLQASATADRVWVAVMAGAGCWLSIYLLLPKPMFVYVFGHELTHALWTWAMGGRLKKFKASAGGGHVVVTKSNFLIALAPYFFPLYAILIMAAYALGSHFWAWRIHALWFHIALGAAYAFHLTLTWHVLKMSQSDVEREGYLFSMVVIFLGNVVVLLVAIPLLSGSVTVTEAMGWWWRGTAAICRRCVQWLPLSVTRP